MALFATVLAGVMVPIEYLDARQFRLGPGSFDKIKQADYGGQGENGIRSVDIAGPILQHLCFAAENQGQGSPGTADVQRLIALV